MSWQVVARGAFEPAQLDRFRVRLSAPLRHLDDYLRRRLGVVEFTQNKDCIFRTQLAVSERDLLFKDGTRIRTGDPLLNLHLWNEQVPTMPPAGATLAWARRMDRCVKISLQELALSLASRRELDGICAVRAEIGIAVSGQRAQMARIMGRYGFEWVAASGPQTVGGCLHRAGENILILLLVLAWNPAALRWNTIRRCRTLTYLSRPTLERRYLPKSQNPRNVETTGSDLATR